MSSYRIPEIDLLRSLAITLMLFYHFAYDLDVYTPAPVHIATWPWTLVGKSSALLFIFLSGVSSNLSRHFLRNGLRLLFWALIITLVTYISIHETYVYFGISHFLGCMLLLYPIFKNRSNRFLILFSTLAIILGILFNRTVGTGPWLLPFGLTYPEFASVDYYPLFPYSGVFVLGILFYRFHYATSQHSALQFLPPFFEKMSRHALLIYILHQPIFLFILFVLQKVRA